MTFTRRRLIAGAGASAAAAAVAAGIPGLQNEEAAEWSARPRLAWAAGRTRPMPPPSPERHLLARATFGQTRGEPARARTMGAAAWLAEQLTVAEDPGVDDALDPLATLRWTAERIQSASSDLANRARIRDELVAATLYRMVHGRRQLFEVMVDHWSNHFNIYMDDYHMMMKTVADRDVMRRYALADFRNLLHADATSVVMMQYLSTLQNTQRGPNENYAREVMELHTLGVDGGYNERDVKEAARCFTGWNRGDSSWLFQFRDQDHDGGAKTVLGTPILGRGVDAGHELLDRLVDHPSCRRHVARRLVRRFVADAPTEALVDSVAAAWGGDGDIQAMLRALFAAPAFMAATADPITGGPAKVRRPMEFWAAVLRGLGADASFLLAIPNDGDYAGRPERYLQLMGQMPFRWRSPDGYPEQRQRWSGAHVMLSRWNFGLAAAEGRLAGIELDLVDQMATDAVAAEAGAIVDYWADRLLARPLLAEDRALLVDALTLGGDGRVTATQAAERLPQVVALIIDSPYFQWR